MSNRILGISSYYHDSAACLLIDGQIVAAAQEERFTREKHDASFPINAVRYCLAEAGITDGKLDAVALYDKIPYFTTAAAAHAAAQAMKARAEDEFSVLSLQG